MTLKFYKFHGAGNDFLLADNRKGGYSQAGFPDQKVIAALCRRNTGIGADGLMLLENEPGLDFKMIYYNSDGLEGTMCGNGGRCLVAFANMLGIISLRTSFMATDGIHEAEIHTASDSLWTISLKMIDTRPPVTNEKGFLVDTGSPHLVIFQKDISDLDVVARGKAIRNASEYAPKGINVNFAEIVDQQNLKIRTYERGVENETMACGTGTVAVAIAAFYKGTINDQNQYFITAPGGNLQVRFSPPSATHNLFRDVILTGPATKVFSAEIDINEFMKNQ